MTNLNLNLQIAHGKFGFEFDKLEKNNSNLIWQIANSEFALNLVNRRTSNGKVKFEYGKLQLANFYLNLANCK